MKLTINGNLYKFYRWTYAKCPPNNLCPFFWQLLFAVVILPITWLTYPWQNRSCGERIGRGLLLWALFISIGFLTSATLSGWYAPIFFIIFMLLGVLIVLLIMVTLCLLIPEGIGYLRNKAINNEITAVIAERKKSWQEKYCPKIEWYFEEEINE